MALALHTNNVTWGGVLQPAGMGVVPTNLVLNTTDNITYTMTFSGAGTVESGADGFSSLEGGVYDLTIDASQRQSGRRHGRQFDDNLRPPLRRHRRPDANAQRRRDRFLGR